MAGIDNKVVSITFDNSAFERNVQQTLRTLATLKSSLDFKGAGDSMNEVSSAASKFSLAGVADAVQNISEKFSAMGAIGFSILNNLTNKAVDAGLAIGKALTITPLTDGFAEYELKMGSIQTIMAGTGESLETVNGYLNDLNEYSDRTIYSFADMTQNIGKFTNAGVSLKDSVAAIQGVANVAAISGANSQQASAAMYNLGQALGSGSVKLRDWMSIETAGMDTVGFKQELIDSAVALGTLTDAGDGLYKTLDGTTMSTENFREALSEGWLSTDVLTGTLGRYSDESTEIGKAAAAAATDIKTFSQAIDTIKESVGSGWAQSFEILFGNFDEGRELWTEFEGAVSGAMGVSADARNAVLSDWKAQGGRELLIDSIREGVKNLAALLGPLKEAFRTVFPAKTGDDLMRMTETFSRFVGMLKPGTKTILAIKSIFTGLFSAVSIVIEVVKGVFSVFKTLFGLFAGGSSGSILAFFAKIGDGVTALRKALVEDGGISKYFEKINEAITKFVNGLSLAPVIQAFEYLKGIVQELPLEQAFDDISKAAGDAMSMLETAFSGITSGFESVKSALSWFFSSDVEDSGLANSETGDNVSRFGMVLSALGGIASGVFNAFKTMLSGLGNVGKFFLNLGGAVKDALAQVWEAIASAMSGADAPNFDNILKVLAGGGIAAIAAAFVSFAKNGFKIDFGQFDVLDELADSLHAVTGGLKAMQKDILAAALLKVAIAIGVLTLSLIALSFIKGGELAKSMAAVAAGLGLLVGALAGIDKIANSEAGAGKIAVLALSLTLIAGAMLLLAIAARLMATADPEELTISLLGMLGALEMIGRVMKKLTENTDGMVKAAFSVGILALSLMLLAAAVALWSTLDPISMALSLFAISAGLTIISETMSDMNGGDMIKSAIAVGLLAISLVILAGAIKMFAKIGLRDTAVGLTTMAISLDIMARVLKRISQNKDVEKAGLAILSISFGMLFMARALDKMGALGLWQLIKGVGAFAIMLRIMGAAVEKTKTSVSGSAAMLLMAAAIYGLGMAIEKVAAIPFWDLVKGMLAIVVAIGVMAGVAALLSPVIPVLAGLGAGLALVGAGMFLFGAGVNLLANAVKILAKVGPEGVEVFIKAITKLITILPRVAAAMGEAAFTFVTSFLSGFDELIPLVVDLIGQLLGAIQELVPQFIETAGAIITAFLGYIVTLYPEIVQAGWDLLLAFLGGIQDNIGELATTAIGIVTEFITAMSEGIPDYVRAMVELFTTILTTMAFELGVLITTLAPQIGMSLIDGILTGLSETGPQVLEFFTGWIGSVIDWVKGLFGINSPSTVFSEIGSFLIDGLLGGIRDTIGAVMDFFTNLLDDVLNWIGDALGALRGTGGDIIQGLWDGHWDIIWKVNDFFNELIGDIVGWIGNALTGLRQTGIDIIKGLLNGINNWMTNVREFFTGLFGTFRDWMGDAGRALYNVGINLVIGLWNGVAYKFYGWMKDKLGWLAGAIPGWIKSALGINSPSKVMYDIGKWIPIGLGMGALSEQDTLKKASEGMGQAITDGFTVDEKAMTTPIRDAINSVIDNLGDLNELSQPVIRPVLDLTDVKRDAKSIGSVLNTSAGLNSALGISAAENANREALVGANAGPTEVKYEQNIHAPVALSTNDIYRQTRSLIAITKEEANIP